jgi:hypothetical protein
VSVAADSLVSSNELNKSPLTSEFLALTHNQYRGLNVLKSALKNYVQGLTLLLAGQLALS